MRIIAGLASSNGWKFYHDDQKTAFLNAVIQDGKWIQDISSLNEHSTD